MYFLKVLYGRNKPILNKDFKKVQNFCKNSEREISHPKTF